MKATIYFDVHPWTTGPDDLLFTAQPIRPKNPDARRFKVEIELPDLFEVDETIQTAAVEVL
uniref:Uncharacterized protein n=1 Tax=viral metagenome TaxID=1070528 RepID=A0A6M3K8P7_9ZZZZ